VSDAAGRFSEAAAAAGLAPDVRRFPEGTRTAEDAARAIGCDAGQIVKSLVFVAGSEPVLALTSGRNRVDPAKLASLCGVSDARKATADEVWAGPPGTRSGVHRRSAIRPASGVSRTPTSWVAIWSGPQLERPIRYSRSSPKSCFASPAHRWRPSRKLDLPGRVLVRPRLHWSTFGKIRRDIAEDRC